MSRTVSKGNLNLKQLEILKCLLTTTQENEELLEEMLVELGVINLNTDEIEPKLDNILSELQKLTDSNLPFHEVLTGTTKTYTNFNSITFTVFDGTAVITVGGSAVTFPLSGSEGDILGANWTVQQLSSQSVTIDAGGGNVYVSTIS